MTTKVVAANVKPTKIHLEAMGACQLKCPACPTATGAIRPTIASGYLRFESFKKLVDENPTAKHIELSNYGEIFLNPQLLPILEYAQQKGVKLTVDNGANLNTVKDELLEGVVKYGLHSMTCSIDGASNETYGIYRVKGHFDTVIANIRRINEFKRKYNSRFPALTWQFIVFGHNEHEIPQARELARELDMEFKPKLNWDEDYSPVKNREWVELEIGKSTSRSDYKEETGVDYSRGICHQLWHEPQINWDGKLLGCCRNFWGDFGDNVFEAGLEKALNNPKIKHARAMLMGQAEPRDDIPCTTCEIYIGMRADRNFITPAELLQQRTLWNRIDEFSKTHRRAYRVMRAAYRATGARRLLHWYMRRSAKRAQANGNGSTTSAS